MKTTALVTLQCAALSLSCIATTIAADTTGANPALDSKPQPLEPQFEACSIGNAVASRPAECATITVPLDPADPSRGELDLAIARIKSHASESDNAFTLIAGGPGQSALDSWPSVAHAFRHITQTQDVILIDQRGTGASSALDCPESDDALNLDPDLESQAIADLATDCLESLEVDPTLFTTSVAVHDLEQVRQKLGINQWNLYGVSYGTRVAMHYARRYTESVRTMILDAVVPPGSPLGPDIAPFAQRALDGIFERCASETGCATRFPDIAKDTQSLLERLRQSNQSVTYEDIATGRLKTTEFGPDHLSGTLRLMSYSATTAALLPSMLSEAVDNNLAPLARQADLQNRSLSDTLSTGMHHAIVCTEDEPFLAERSSKSTSYLGDALVDALKASCSVWPAGYIDDDFHDTLAVEVPTLILSGEMDPITPPAYGDLIASSLPVNKHIINPGQGHMQAPLGCMPSVMAYFLSEASVEQLPMECLERLKPPPFFVDANGPLP